MTIVKTCVALLLAALVPAASAQIYKWVDEKGRVHYGEKPPAGSKPSAVKPPAAQPDAPAQGQSLQAQELEFRRRQVERGQDEDRRAHEAAQREALCNEAKARLALAERSVLYRREKGEKVLFSDAEQKAEIESRRAAATRNCR